MSVLGFLGRFVESHGTKESLANKALPGVCTLRNHGGSRNLRKAGSRTRPACQSAVFVLLCIGSSLEDRPEIGTKISRHIEVSKKIRGILESRKRSGPASKGKARPQKEKTGRQWKVWEELVTEKDWCIDVRPCDRYCQVCVARQKRELILRRRKRKKRISWCVVRTRLIRCA